MRTFLATFFAVFLAILAAAGILCLVLRRRHTRPAATQISQEETYARQLMKGLGPSDVITVCGKPSSDYEGDYGDFKWRVLTYPNFEANFILQDGNWRYDFVSDGHGRVLPDSSMVTRPDAIKLPCQR